MAMYLFSFNRFETGLCVEISYAHSVLCQNAAAQETKLFIIEKIETFFQTKKRFIDSLTAHFVRQ